MRTINRLWKALGNAGPAPDYDLQIVFPGASSFATELVQNSASAVAPGAGTDLASLVLPEDGWYYLSWGCGNSGAAYAATREVSFILRNPNGFAFYILGKFLLAAATTHEHSLQQPVWLPKGAVIVVFVNGALAAGEALNGYVNYIRLYQEGSAG